ncbi:MAG: hypothetical protein GY860_02170 [Desulfobacteraceae bacterium]|nr:hypothetical protein [Desulfobacteraceae bacterium]
MKILDAKIIVRSHNSSEQMNLMLKEESQTHLTETAPGPSNNRLASIGAGIENLSMVVDRVSLSQTKQVEYQSGYSSEISSRSGVRSEDTSETKVFEQKEMLENLVGGVIDRAVVVRQLARGENISIDKGLATPKSTLEESFASSRLSGEKIISLKRTDIIFEEEQMTFASTGEVITEDGRRIEFSLDLSMDRSFLSKTEQESLIHTWKEQVVLTDPLVISLDGSLPKLSDTGFEFDLDNDGEMETVSFVSAGSGFLAFDKNEDQKINNGSELFGPGTGNGFEELAAWDGDKNNWIDENDAVFSKLSVWTKDENGEDRLISLKNAGIGAICLENAATHFDMVAQDNYLKGRLKSSGIFLFENGNVGSIQQIDLAARPIENEKKDSELKLAVNNPFSVASVSDRSPILSTPGPMVGSLEGQPVQNPLEALVEQIKALREEMNLILGKKPSSSGLGRFFSGPGKKNGFSPSNYQLYQINPDSFFLLSGRKIDMGQDRYA